MEIKRVSAISGVERVKDIPVNPDDYIAWKNGEVSMNEAMPYLNDEDREFILSGIIKDEWNEIFKNEVNYAREDFI